MAEKIVAAPAVYQLDPVVRARILSESPRAQALREIEAQRQAFMAMHGGCPFGAMPLDTDISGDNLP